MNKSPKKAPLNTPTRAELKKLRREHRISLRRSDDETRKIHKEGKRKDFSLVTVTWILNRCDRIEVLGDNWRTCIWIFKSRIVAEWSVRFATPRLVIRGFGAYKEVVDIRDRRFDPDSFGRSCQSLNVRARK